ncbi:MAG: ketopantoate reductase family protein [Clostridium sp.]|nr:ketopantoate reductase family protein [Clostridium sp.]
MNKVKNVIICGLGAIGTIYAARIADAGNINLKILLDEERIEKYKTNPTVFNNKEYSFDYITGDYCGFNADLIIIATKNSGLMEAVYAVKNFVNENTVFLSLLNGISSEDVIASVYGFDKVLYSYYIGHTSTRQGRSIVHDGVYKTVFGEKDNQQLSKNVLKVKEFFDSTGIPYEIPVDMDYSRWWKFLVNVGYNQASAVLNASYGVFQNSERANNLAINLMQEAADLAKAMGVKNTHQLIAQVLDVIKTMLPETRTSMLQDIDAKRQTEVGIFAGYIVESAKKYSISVPYNKVVLDIISAIDEKNAL